DERERRSVGERPRRRDRTLAEQRAACLPRRKAGQQLVAADGEETRIARRGVGMIAAGGNGPVEPRELERARVVRIRQAREVLDAAEEMRELVAAALAHGIGELAVEVAEVRERARRVELLSHEEQDRRRQEEQQRLRGAHSIGRREHRQPLAEGPVADLVVVLQKVDERIGRQVRRRLAARLAVSMTRRLALIREAFDEAAKEALAGAVEVLVVA